MKNLIIIALFVLICTCISYAQKETNIWYFGEKAGLDFNNGSLVPLLDGQLDTVEGVASISDKSGNLLFYTDGTTVFNKNHDVMLNGRGLKGHFSSTNSAIIVPKPEDGNIYYIFTTDADAGVNGFQYSEVNMMLDSGLGAITSNKNILLYSPSNEKITAVRSSTWDSYWVITQRYNTNEFIVYNVSASGVNVTPVISSTGRVIELVAGAMKVSPNGKKLALATFGFGVDLYDFNDRTGEVTNHNVLIENTWAYGVEFSPKSNFLYTSFQNIGVYQHDMNAGSISDIINSLVVSDVANPENILAMQLASDGKIYIAGGGQESLSAIFYPNKKGFFNSYRKNNTYLSGRTSQAGLPTFVQSFFSEEIIFDEPICFGGSTKFSLSIEVESINWDFGDPITGDDNTSTELTPTHVFSSAGSYQVTADIIINSKLYTLTHEVNVNRIPDINTEVEFNLCSEECKEAYDLNGISMSIIRHPDYNELVAYYESRIDAEVDENRITNTSEYVVKDTNGQIVWGRVDNGYGCYSITQIKLITILPFPKYFTPNGDGINDYWQLNFSNTLLQEVSNIFIYNRFGKFIKQISPSSRGWDGTFNGKKLASDDYWFRVSFDDGKIYTGHFALKR